MRMFRHAGRRLAITSSLAVGLTLTALTTAPGALAAGGEPTTPTQLFSGYRNCSGDPAAPTFLWATRGVTVEGMPGDTDSSQGPTASVQYRYWPQSDPSRVGTLTDQYAALNYESPATVPADALTDGQVYGWQAQTVVGGASSDWSSPCYFEADDTAPSPVPTVTSSNYPQGQWDAPGDPVHFTFDANGADDVEGFEFAWFSELPVAGGANIGDYGVPQPVDPYTDTAYFVRADHLGGSASVDLVPPGSGPGPCTW